MNDWVRQLEAIGGLPYLKPFTHVLVILALAWVSLRMLRGLLRSTGHRLTLGSADPEAARRSQTMLEALRRVSAGVVYVTAGMLLLSELGISIAPLLATAGVAGIAVGFAAQSLVKDYFAGFVMLWEDQIHQGDVVEIAGQSGLVEEVSLRFVRLRDYEGNVHFVPNGAISSVTNRSRGFAYALMDVGVAYREDVDAVFAVMREVGAAMREDAELAEKILEDLEIAGVNQWADSAVVVRCRLKVAPLQQWVVRREFLKRLKAAFDRSGIEIPYPHLTVYAGQSRSGEAPAFPLELTSPPQEASR